MDNFQQNEKTDSISLSKTSTGKYSFDVKIYSKDLLAEGEDAKILKKISEIHDKLAEKFPSEKK